MTATAQLFGTPYTVFTSPTGAVLASGKLYSYQAGTTTPQATYTDETAGTPNTNPQILDTAGRATVFLRTDLSYKFVLYDSASNLIGSVDNINVVNPSSIDKTKIAANIAGLALLQNGTGAIDVQVDNVTLQINGSNQVAVKAGGLTQAALASTSIQEVVIKNVRDLNFSGGYNYIPQYAWTSPSILSNPGTLPPGGANVARWSPNGEFLAVGSGTSTYFDIYQRSGTLFTKLADPITMPGGSVTYLSWSPCGDFLYVGTSKSGDCTRVYQRTGNSFASITSFGSAASSTSTGVSISPNSDFLVSTLGSGAHIQLLIGERSGTTFNDITSASTLGSVNTLAGPICWSPDSSLLFTMEKVSNLMDAYYRADTLFTAITAPDITGFVGAGDIIDMAVSPNGNFLAVATSLTPYVLLYSITGTGSSATFAKLSNPGTLPAGAGNCVAWSPNSQYLCVGHSTTPFMTIYSVSGSTFTKLVNPSSLPAGAVTGADWSPTNQFLAVTSGTTPYIQVYQTASALSTNILPWVRAFSNV